jgi:NADH:ubiquinone oxidoreductase subunit D
MSRSTGIKRDLRLSTFDTYANYYYLNFRGYIGVNGDCYDRFLIRMNEMAEGVNIINQIIDKLTKFSNISYKQKTNTFMRINPHIISNFLLQSKNFTFNTKNNYNSMEALINHFKY